MSYAVGDRYWIPDDEHAWLAGTLKEFKNSVLEFSTDKGVRKFRVADLKTKLETCGSHIDDNVENLVDLDELSEGAILHHTRIRFAKKIIYTHVGSILVAVNPFENLAIYGERDIRRAFESTVAYPHVFVTAATAYQQLCNNRKNQAVLISGESGAGKTETTKKVLTYLAQVAPDAKPKAAGEASMENKILQSNPLLEALGNAKTLRNNNSSRFGKWMKVGFDSVYKIQGCEIVNYLLEKSRVVVQSSMERNYHIFYQLMMGADANTRARLHLKTPADYHYLNQSGCIKIEGVDDAAEFKEVTDAMATLQFSSATCESVFKIIAALLHLGNVSFEMGSAAESSKVTSASQETLQFCAELLGLNVDMFLYSLTEKKVQMGRGSIISITLSQAQAVDSRDTLAKTIYGNMFDWTIASVNATLKTSEAPFTIGILDIFGFEVFEFNSFEQLCINYANEKLQFHFNEVIFNVETAMYLEEGISLDKVVFEDNSECVNLIEGKPYGLLSLLEEECSLGNATDLSYINKVEKAFGTGKPQANKFFIKNKVKPDCFSVCHFAGAVEYNVANFLDKNRDTLSQTSREVMEQSQVPLVAELFARHDAPASAGAGAAASGGGGGGGGGKKQQGGSTKSTLGGQFRNQLIGLVTALKLTEPHFIRCVKPNHAKVGGLFDGQLALRQLRYAGLFEAIRIRKSGFAYRANFKTFASSYQILVDGLSLKRQSQIVDDPEACRLILTQATKDNLIKKEDWHVGTTRVFLKTNQHRTVLERQKVTRVTVFVVRIQHAALSFIERMKANRIKYELMKERNKKEAERLVRVKAAIMIQKNFRRLLVKNMMQSMQNLIELRRVLAKREINRIREVLQLIDHGTKTDHMLASMFQHEIRVARVMLQLIQIQDALVDEIQKALDNSDVSELNRLLVKSERLEMTTHPIVLQAKEELVRLNRKRKVLKTLVNFLRNEDEFTDSILETIAEAKTFDIDPEFIAKVQRVHDNAGPRLKIRNKLRAAIETVDRFLIEQNCIEVFHIQKLQPNFGESELRAAKALLRLLHFDYQLEGNDPLEKEPPSTATAADSETEKPSTHSSSSSSVMTSLWGKKVLTVPTGPLLSKDIIDCCNAICVATDPNVIKQEKKRLQDHADNNVNRLYAIIRYFKWSKTVCTWKYPETLSALKAASGGSSSSAERGSTSTAEENERKQDVEFYGLRPAESRCSAYVIRTLHKDFDSAGAASSALMLAAVSNIENKASVSDTLNNLDQMINIDLDIKLPNGQKFNKTKKNNGVYSPPRPESSLKTVVKAPLAHSPVKRVEKLDDSNIEKQLHNSRVNFQKQLKKVEKDLAFAKRTAPNKGWK